jgi:hypothetical protein
VVSKDELGAAGERPSRVVKQSSLATYVFSLDGLSLAKNEARRELWDLEAGETPEGSNAFEDDLLRAVELIAYIEESPAGSETATLPLLLHPLEYAVRPCDPRWLGAFVHPSIKIPDARSWSRT